MAIEDERKLFVAGLPESITEDVLRQLFEATGGKVVDVSLPRDRMTGRPRGFGFVTLASAEEASNARMSLDGSLQAGRPMSVRPFQAEAPRRGDPREGGSPSMGPKAGPMDRGGGDRTLYVGNLPYDCAPPQIEELFANYGVGPVVRVHLPSGPDGRPRGFGFITLGSAEAANEAVVALRDADLRGRRLSVSIAHPRGSGERDSRAPGPGLDRMDSFRPSREPMPERRAPSSVDAPPPPLDALPDDDRRRGAGADKGKKKKKGAGGAAARGPEKRGRERHWEDWDDDES
jgi:RNA recognition motif-containing protein